VLLDCTRRRYADQVDTQLEDQYDGPLSH
jgi:hypothetical protein